MSVLRDYSNQARTYDETRAASPSVLGPLREALAGAPGRRLADIGGGTGNYARALRDEGWDPVVIDREPGMLVRAAAKGLETIEADAQRLPLADESVDAAMLVSMLHHVEKPAAAVAEAQRVLRPGGRLALMVFTREDTEASWLNDYFPSTREWMLASHQPLDELLTLVPGARHLEVHFRDLEDGSLAALQAYPEKIVEPEWHRQTSFFERLARDHPDELAAGLARIRAELADGTAPNEPGLASVLAWVKPG
jgi:demethylmenaquinone methyltransferase/2-methoxy-6-polyprenyl-1,4-benzoquinol methylase